MLEDDYGYDGFGRLGSVSSGTCTATYGYVLNSDLLQTTAFRNNGNAVMTTTRTWNFGFQLASIANTVAGATAPVTSHAYTYDACNRRTEAKLEDGSAWEYGYNDRNELTSANRHWYDSQPVSGQQFGYAYDNIGNRTLAQFGGDTNGANLQTISYTANNLNQYTSITTPTSAEICGAALATNTVMVNSALADRHGEYFHREISTGNGSGADWQNVTVNSGGVGTSGGMVLPPSTQSPVYDPDGNLTFDGVWNYRWDGENRLLSMNMTNIAGFVPNAQGFVTNRLRLDFAYDYLGRRIQKTVSIWNSTANGFQTSSANSFVYDGWNLVAILNPQSSILQSFVWGNDLSGTMTDAGGVGGLLMVGFPGTNCFVIFDGNGNATALVNAADKSVAARYEYSPYGKLIRETGALASQNPFRFSTKFWDDESGLIYNNVRYYSPQLGRWISSDSVNDPDSPNLFCFVLNAPNGIIDPNGNSPISSLGRATFLSILTAVNYYIQGIHAGPDTEAGKELFEKGNQALHGMLEWSAKTAKEAKAIKSIATKRYSGYTYPTGRDPNGWARKGKNLTRNGGRLPRGMFTALSIGLMVYSAEEEAEAGAIAHLAGDDSSATAQMYKDLDRGDDAWADLDAIISAADSTGSTDEGALVAVAVNFDAEEVYSSPDSGSKDSYADLSAGCYETITIKQ